MFLSDKGGTSIYQISDTLLNHKELLENHLETVEKNLHGYKSTIALYDLTNIHKWI